MTYSPSSSISRRRAEASEERRGRVLQAANFCFSRWGYQKTSVDQIARKAEVSKGLVFVFFGTKEALFQAVVNDTLEQWRQFSEAAAAHAESPAEELRRLFTGSFHFVQRHPMLGVLLGRVERGWMLQSPDVERENRSFQGRLQQVLRNGVLNGSLRSDLDLVRAAEVIHELQWSLLDRQLDTMHADRDFDLSLADDAVELLLSGLRRR
jgi:AcrR family transcriptional regulator